MRPGTFPCNWDIALRIATPAARNPNSAIGSQPFAGSQRWVLNCQISVNSYGFVPMTDRSHSEMLCHYDQVSESSRLSTGVFQIERARTEELILRHLPPPPATVFDIGGGAGAYALWLAARGYAVHLLDPVLKHVEQARAGSMKQAESPLASAEIGDARQISFSDNSADAVLLLGPLYHLLERDDRLEALREAERVVRPGGFVWGAGISRFASLFDSLSTGFFSDPVFATILTRDLAEGQHRNPTDNPAYFTDAYFHRPGELSREFLAAGFEVVSVVAIEGPGWLARDFDQLWKDRAQRERLLDYVRKVEREPSILGASAHIMCIGRKRSS
jgi:ubiquinone/menaquinone biosynthesis C-methylase UbiE